MIDRLLSFLVDTWAVSRRDAQLRLESQLEEWVVNRMQSVEPEDLCIEEVEFGDLQVQLDAADFGQLAKAVRRGLLAGRRLVATRNHPAR